MKATTLSRLVLAGMVIVSAAAAHAEGEIETLAEEWVSAYNKHDKEALGNLYAEDAVLMMHGAPSIKGRTNIKIFWEGDFEVGSPLTLLKVTHSVVGIDMMLVHGDYEVIDRKDGALLGEGRFAHIWMVDEDGEWRLDRDLWNQPYSPVN